MYKISFNKQKRTKIDHIIDNHIELRFLYILGGSGLLCGGRRAAVLAVRATSPAFGGSGTVLVLEKFAAHVEQGCSKFSSLR